MKILLIHCHYRLPGGEDAVFAAERALLEQHGHTVVTYERSNEEAAHGAARALLPLRAVWNRRAARDVRNIIKQEHILFFVTYSTGCPFLKINCTSEQLKCTVFQYTDCIYFTLCNFSFVNGFIVHIKSAVIVYHITDISL